jgi:hypothetical protein
LFFNLVSFLKSSWFLSTLLFSASLVKFTEGDLLFVFLPIWELQTETLSASLIKHPLFFWFFDFFSDQWIRLLLVWFHILALVPIVLLNIFCQIVKIDIMNPLLKKINKFLFIYYFTIFSLFPKGNSQTLHFKMKTNKFLSLQWKFQHQFILEY